MCIRDRLRAAALLAVAVLPFAWVHAHQRCRPKDRGREVAPDRPLSGEGGFQALFQDRYLLLIGLLTLLVNWVTNSGEYVLDRTLVDFARSSALGPTDAARFVGQFKAEYFWWVNALGVLGQFFVAVSYTHLRAHETPEHLVCRLLLEKKK